MESSPFSENNKMEVDLCTPSENLKKQHQEITPDNPTQPQTKLLLGAKKASVVGSFQKLSKRKLFGQPVDQTSGNENVCETVHKKKRSDDPIKHVTNDNRQKRLLTERQQLAFLLEATSTRENAEDENDNTFTKVKSRKKIKRNGKCVNPRVYRRNERGETPLHLAAIKGDVVSLKKLIKDGAEVGLKDYAGWTALHEACNHGNLEAAKLLVKHGAAVNVPGFEGDTPLHDAVVNNHIEVVNMLLSRGANPHQTNMRRKKPTDLINSKEMRDIFNLRGVQHTTLEKRDMKVLSEEITTSGSAEKSNSDNERSHVRGSILGNEIQRKETQGESKMEKPVMYICKLEPRNEELTIRTTQVTSYKKCSNVEVGSQRKNSESEVCKESGQKPDTLKKEVLGVDKKNEAAQSSTEGFTARHKVKGTLLKDDASSLQFESRGQFENTRNKLSVSTSVCEDFKTGAKEMELVASNDEDKTNTKLKMPSYGSEKLSSLYQEIEHSEDKQVSINNDDTKLPVSFNSCEEFANRSKETDNSGKKQKSIHVQDEENENTTREPSLVIPASDDPPTESQEMKNCQVHVERSRTPEIDESIAVEVLSTGLLSGAPGFSQYHYPITLTQQEKVMKNPSYMKRDVSDVYTSGGQRYETPKNPSYRGVPVADVQTSLNEGLVEQEASEQSSISNDELFLDVEGFEPDLEENQTSLEKHLIKKKQSVNPKEQENVISSTTNHKDDDEKTKEHTAASFLTMNESGLSTVSESGQIGKQCSKFVSENTKRSKQTTILDGFSGVEDTHLWKLDDTTSEKDGNRYRKDMISNNSGYIEEAVSRAPTSTGGHNIDDVRPWQLEKKAQGRKKVGLRNSIFTREDKITGRNAGQPISSNNHDNISWEVDTRSSTGIQERELPNSQRSTESTIQAHGVNIVKPLKPTVTWQSLMAAGRCQLTELRIPGYDQFLMKTKEYELATDVNQAKSIEAPGHSTEENEVFLKHEKSKQELLRKQRSEQDKLQLCMEQEMVRFYTKRAYSSLKCNQPPGVCTAIYWQNISSRQLRNEKKKLSQKLYVEKDQISPSDHEEIIEKFDKLKSAMVNRHKHEQQALEAVIKRELESCV